MSVIPTFAKTATAKRDYTIDWSDAAPGDNLASVSWSVPAGLTTVTTGMSGGAATIRLSGGTLDGIYTVRCTATRASGQVDRRAFQILIVPRIVVLPAVQDPSAALDYTLDASALFGSDTISSYAWTVSGISISGASNAATVRLTGGSANTIAYADCHMVSVGGQEDDRSIEIVLQDL